MPLAPMFYSAEGQSNAEGTDRPGISDEHVRKAQYGISGDESAAPKVLPNNMKGSDIFTLPKDVLKTTDPKAISIFQSMVGMWDLLRENADYADTQNAAVLGTAILELKLKLEKGEQDFTDYYYLPYGWNDSEFKMEFSVINENNMGNWGGKTTEDAQVLWDILNKAVFVLVPFTRYFASGFKGMEDLLPEMYAEFNPGIILKPGDVHVLMMQGNLREGKGIECFYRDGKLLYTISLPDMKKTFTKEYWKNLETPEMEEGIRNLFMNIFSEVLKEAIKSKFKKKV